MSFEGNGAATVALLNYGMGNLRSVAKALEHAGARVRVAETPDQIGDAAGMVLPGVGALPDCVAALEKSGLGKAVREWIAADRPFLGVCLGLQALFEHSEEGDCKGLGVFPGKVVRFSASAGLKIPHMGWNTVRVCQPDSPLWRGLSKDDAAFYFVHSFHCVPAEKSLVLAECDYGVKFTAVIQRGRCFATQFHPEKSQSAGLSLYKNFVGVCASAR